MPENKENQFYVRCMQLFKTNVKVTEFYQKYKIKADGIYLLHRDKQGAILQEQLITHKPLLITGFLYEPEADITYVQLELYHARAWHKLPLKTLEEISRTNPIITLANNNVDINISNARQVIEYLSCLRSCLQEVLPQQKLCKYLGWEQDKFYLPGRGIDNSVFMLSDGELYRAVAQGKGEWETWLATYGRLCGSSIVARFIISCALAAPLLERVGFKGSPLVLLYGKKGSGKSTLMRFAASVWGNDNFMYPCNGTLSGFELRAKLLSGLPFFLDDVQLMRGRADFNDFMQAFIYMLFNGYGKQRATKELGSAKLNRWQTLNILSSETTVVTPEFYGGAARRILEISLPKALERELISECNKTSAHCYGLAGRRLLDLLEAQPAEVWQQLYEKACDRLFLLDDGKHEATWLMVLALVLLADALFALVRAGENDIERLPPLLDAAEEVVLTVLSEIENSEERESGTYYHEALVDTVSANYDCFGYFDDANKKVVNGTGYKSYGFFYGDKVYINSKVFTGFLKQFGRPAKSIKTLLRDAKLIEADEGRFTKQLNLTFNNCYRPRMVCMKYGEQREVASAA